MKVAMLFAFGRYLGVDYIAAFLENKGHDVRLIMDPFLFHWWGTKGIRKVFDYNPIIVDQIVKLKPDLVGFSVIADSFGWACRTADEIKKRLDVPIIFGGVHPSSVPEIVLSEQSVDYICIGEGEEAMLELVEALEKNEDTTKIANIWTKNNGVVIQNPLRKLRTDLDSLPFPGTGTYDGEVKDTRWFCGTYSITTTRGCAYKCTYCIHSSLSKYYKGQGPYFRRRSVDNVIAELKFAKEKFKVKTIFMIEDEILTSDFVWTREFCFRYKSEIGVPYACQTHPKYLNEEIVHLLEDSGCVALGLGIQTVDDELKKKILNRIEVSENVAEHINLLRKSKILLVANMMLNFPGQDEAEMINIAKFLNSYSPDLTMFFSFRYYPGTEIINIAQRENLLTNKERYEIEHSKEWNPFKRGCNILYEKGFKSLVAVVLISHSLPKGLLYFILERKLYEKCSWLLRIFVHLFRILMFVVKFFYNRPKKLMYQLTFFGVWKYLFFTMSKALWIKGQLFLLRFGKYFK